MIYVERDHRGRYAIHDLDVVEMHALQRALTCASLPDRRVLDGLQRQLARMD